MVRPGGLGCLPFHLRVHREGGEAVRAERAPAELVEEPHAWVLRQLVWGARRRGRDPGAQVRERLEGGEGVSDPRRRLPLRVWRPMPAQGEARRDR